MDGSRQAGAGAHSDLVLYTRPGCHLCDEARKILDALLEQRRADGRATPRLVERDISSNQEWERAYFASIPVVELGHERIELATSAAKIRALLARLDATPSSAARQA